MISRADAIVVGAGPAGSTAARRLAEGGARVVLLDRARFPREKLCGGGLTAKALGLLPAGAGDVVQRWVDRVEIRSRVGTFEIAESLARVGMVDRRELDLRLVGAAAIAGVDVREGLLVTGARSGAADAEVTFAGGGHLTATVLVVADGEPSRLAASLGLRSSPGRRVLALEASVPSTDAALRDHAVLGCRVPGGYAWYFPKADHASVGVGSSSATRQPRLRADLDIFAQSLGLRIERASVRGHWIPMGLRRGPLVTGRALLVGDAAGAADPLFAEGIAFALATGTLAARSIGGLLDGRTADLTGYERAVRAAFGGRMRQLAWGARLSDVSVSIPLLALRTSSGFRRYSAGFVNDFGTVIA